MFEKNHPQANLIPNAGGQDLLELPTVITDVFNHDSVEIGIKVNQLDDSDQDFVYVYPTIYVQNPKPSQPRHIIMLVDTSSSMKGAGIDAMHKTLPKIFSNLKDDDIISLISFSDK